MQNSTLLAWLVGYEGTTGEIRFELSGSETTIGRESNCDFQVDDPLASRKHAIIYLRADGFEIEDLNSSNGTFVNNEQITRVPLQESDLIRIGDTILKFRMEPDLDATIIQKRPSEETVVALRPTIPHEHGAVHCRSCGQPNPKGGKFCAKCGDPLPQLPTSFQKTLDDYIDIQTSYKAGELNSDEYHAALTKLIVQDDKGDFWMLGVESGEWYWHDGNEWHLRLPPLLLSKEEQPVQPDRSIPQEPDQPDELPPQKSRSGRWGVVAAWLLSALIVLAFGIYAVAELISYSRFQSLSQLDPIAPLAGEDSYDSSETAAGESELPLDLATPTIYAQESKNEIQARPYDASRDASLINLADQTEYLPDQSSEEHSIYEGYIDQGSSGFLTMAWCAIDQVTLENNMESIRMEGTFDSVTIPPAIWTIENSQEEGMYCRFYRTVIEDLGPGTHKFFWSTSYDVPIFDGWATYPSGTYINEFILKIEDQYNYNDSFDSSAEHWGESDREDIRVWIEGGNLHIELYEEQIGAWSRFRDREFDDFTIVTQASSISQNPGYYGFVFRQQDIDNFYYFQISDDGSFNLSKKVNGEEVDLIPWTASDAISRNGGVNKLYLSMEGIRILAYVNDQLVVDTNDGSLKDGNLCLMAFSPDGGSHISFQQVSIEAPE